MDRIDMSKRIVIGREVPDGTYIGKLRGMRVYLEGSVGDDIICVRTYLDKVYPGGKYQPVADLNLSKDYCDGAYHVDLMRVDHRFQGHGLAPLLYRYVLRKLGIVLQAGKYQSAGGRKLWAQLAKMKDVTVFACYRRGKEALVIDDLDQDDEELHHESVKLYDGRTIYTFAVAA